GGARLLDARVERVRQVPELAPAVDVDRPGADRIRADQRTLDQLVRVALHDLAVLEGTRLALVSVDGDVSGFRVLRDEAPLHAGGEARAAAPAQPRRLDHLDHLVGREGHSFFEALVAAVFHVN